MSSFILQEAWNQEFLEYFEFQEYFVEVHQEISIEFGQWNSEQTGQLNPLFHTIVEFVNRVVARLTTDWSLPNSQFSLDVFCAFLFSIGNFIMILILLHDNTWYLLNVYVQSIGYYLQNILQLGFHTGKNKFNRNDNGSFFTSTPLLE